MICSRLSVCSAANLHDVVYKLCSEGCAVVSDDHGWHTVTENNVSH